MTASGSSVSGASARSAAADATFGVVIATRDRPALLAAQLERLERMETPPDEVVVIDDSPAGRGPSACRNDGLARLTTTWAIFLDDDDEPDDEWMATFRGLAARHPSAVHLSVGHRDRAGVNAPTVEVPVQALGPAFGSVCAAFLGGTFAVRVELVRRVGGFDAALRHMEFTDLALRLFEAIHDEGRPVAVDPAPRITLVRRPPGERSSQRPEVVLAAGERVLERTAHLWARDPRGRADQHGVLGVAAARAGDGAGARRHFAQALRLRRDGARLARWVISSVPVARRRVWPPMPPPR